MISPPMITTRLRITLLVAISVIALGAAGIYLVQNSTRAVTGAPTEATPVGSIPALEGPHIVFRSSRLGPDYGKLAVVGADDAAGPRTVLDLGCERIYATPGSSACVAAKRGIVPSYRLISLDDRLRPVAEEELIGLPSRVRMSADGAMVATTTFVTGHSYAGSSFSTETIVRHDGRRVGNLEEFAAVVDGRPMTAVNRNFWGVTFAADDDTFYVTAAIADSTWLMRGSVSKRTLTSIRGNVECPSLSPDGTKIAYKKRLPQQVPVEWRIAVLDLASGVETMIADDRSVDDQVEWLDNGHLLYAIPRPGDEATVTDVWVTPADGTGAARIAIPEAGSPAVVRGGSR
ncbi:PD40 domain-containing protein [Microlunatus speluncae]|uniref:PD40 domain-containing protein n=1 Tax=Microlunatus speluncae TaxID=2594267 RepID=UPI00126638F3|nr:PD40 domain-containing protein [Microlunatus speluncae]